MTEETQFLGFMFPQGSAETLVRNGGITNSHSMHTLSATCLPQITKIG